MIKKSFYEAPEAELLLVKFEEGFLTGTNKGGFGDKNANPDDLTDEDWWNQNN